ncbi:OmpA family protein [Thermoflexibacter ruber]|uniref:Outer membrane protein OmpA n=1 Tax=Thermoflexibacter ruber TaxID=1003 RepID=A0A1I2JPD4_9BACT|nr:OmpA family protein [Thermoflexibacter ruber]SFF54636.1 Outer membrane protein OmpA [Thermoflexibacter ruber]
MRYLLIFISYLICYQAHSQLFTNYNSSNSPLPFDKINCIAIDQDGTKWIGTDKGFAALLPNEEWKVYNKPNSTDTLLTKITAVTVDKQGNKWLASFRDKIYLFKLDKAGNYLLHNEIPVFQNKNYYINDIAIDHSGNKWLATKAGGVWKIDTQGKWFCYDQSIVLEFMTDEINAVAVDERNEVWVASAAGLWSTKDGKEWQPYDIFDNITTVEVGDKGQVCIGVSDKKGRQKLYCNDVLFKLSKDVASNKYFKIKDLTIDREGIVWAVGTGIARYQKEERALFDLNTSGFTSNLATCVEFEDSKGVLWIGTADQGLFRLGIYEKKQEVQVDSLSGKRPQIVLNPNAGNLNLNQVKVKPAETNIEEEETEIASNEATVVSVKPETTPPPTYSTEDSLADANATVTLANKTIRKGEIINLENIQFKKASYELSSTEGVETLLMFMKENPEVHIELAGHTEKNPDKDHPDYKRLSKLYLELSQKRVETVAKYLINRGISASRIITKAYGGEKPLFNYSTERNRRVEMRIIKIK